MKAAIRSIYLISALSLFAITAYADNAAPTPTPAPTTTSTPNLVGNYKCTRTDASNNNTSYPLSITKTGDTYTLEWDSSNGDPQMYGTGIVHPNMTNVLASSFWDLKNSDISGVEIFSIKPDGSLSANWTLQSSKDVGSETCTKS